MNNSVVRCPSTVVLADNNPAYSYGFQSPSTPNSSGGWFSGLRAKISQIAGISEWMSQLGLGDSNGNMAAAAQGQQTQYPSEGKADVEDDTLSYHSITLDDCPASPDRDIDDPWDFGASLLADLDSSYSWGDTLERQHFGPLKDLLSIGTHRGQGHNFISVSLLHPTWCDKCGDFIWGILKQATKCEQCNYTCHQRCRNLVTLDCHSAGSTFASEDFPSLYPKLHDGTLGTIPHDLVLPDFRSHDSEKENDSDKENGIMIAKSLSSSKGSATLPKSFAPISNPSGMKASQFIQTSNGQTLLVSELYVKEDTPFEWSQAYRDDELAKNIEQYNQIAEGLPMKLSEDDQSFSGYLQIHMNFTRPISIVAGEKPPTVYDIVNTEKSAATLRTITSFFLPRNTVKTINMNSNMTTRQMIVTLLRKFRVADNPRKFALYECVQETDEQTSTLLRKMTRISDDVCPLKVALSWRNDKCAKTFVLQENDTGDILWDAFEIPELDNFLRILRMEEQQYQWQIRQRYSQYKYYVDEELRRRGYSGEDKASAPPLELAPEPPDKDYSEYGTGGSMVVSDVFRTIRSDMFVNHRAIEEENKEPIYVNIDFLRERNMEQSTRL